MAKITVVETLRGFQGVLAGPFESPDSLYLAGLVLGAAAVVALLYAQRPAVTRGTVVALAPWMAAGAVLHALYASGRYPAVVESMPALGAYLTTTLVVGLAWAVLDQLAVGQRGIAELPQYLGAMGIGTVTVLVTFAVWQGGPLSQLALVWLVVVPLLAGAVAAVVWVLLGLGYTDAVAYTGIVGALVVFAHAFDAISTTIGVGVVGPAAHTPLSRAVARAVEAAAVGTSPALSWVGLFVWIKLAVAIGALAVLANYVKVESTRGHLLLGLVTAAGLVPGVNALFTFLLT